MKLIGSVRQQGAYVFFFHPNSMVKPSSVVEQTIQDLEKKIKAQEKAIRDRDSYIKVASTIAQDNLKDAKATVAGLTSKLTLVESLIADSEAQECKESEVPLQAELIEGMYANKAKIQTQLEEEEAYVLELTEELAEVNEKIAFYQKELPQAKEMLHRLKVKLGLYLTETIMHTATTTPSMA